MKVRAEKKVHFHEPIIFLKLIFMNLFFGTNSDVNHRLFTHILVVSCIS